MGYAIQIIFTPSVERIPSTKATKRASPLDTGSRVKCYHPPFNTMNVPPLTDIKGDFNSNRRDVFEDIDESRLSSISCDRRNLVSRVSIASQLR